MVMLVPFRAFRPKNLKESNVKSLSNLTLEEYDLKTDYIRHNIEYAKNSIISGNFLQDSEPAFYCLRMFSKDSEIKGDFLIALVSKNQNNYFYKHEKIKHHKKETYKALIKKNKLQLTPILAIQETNHSFDSIIESIKNYDPLMSFNLDETQFNLWKISNPLEIKKIQKAFINIKKFLIADGHHRFSIFTDEVEQDFSHFSVAFTTIDHLEMKVSPRVLLQPIQLPEEEILRNLSKYFEFKEEKQVHLNDSDIYWMCLPEKRYALKKIVNENSPQKLDIFSSYVVDQYIFGESFRIPTNVDTSNFIVALPGYYKLEDASDILTKLKASCVVFPPLFHKQDLFENLGMLEKLPHTSTWFEPKIPECLIVFDADIIV